MTSRAMPTEAFPTLEGEVKIQDVGGQVFLESEGDSWYCSVTLSDAAVIGLQEWLSCYRQARGI